MSSSDFGARVFLRLDLKFANSDPNYLFASTGEPIKLLPTLGYVIELALTLLK
jgi:hypothetical protein